VKSTAQLTGTAKLTIPGVAPLDLPLRWFRVTFSDGSTYNFDDPQNKYEMLKKRLGK
jgi:hypothetical protein